MEINSRSPGGGLARTAASPARQAPGAGTQVEGKRMKSPVEGYVNRERGDYAVYQPPARGAAVDIEA